MKLLVLSPHRDDAAFSLALSISRWLAEGHRVHLLNVFTRSLYAPYSDADTVHENDRLGYISALRKREDEKFLGQLNGLTMTDLNIKDAPIRLHCDSSIVCDMDVDPDDKAIGKVQKAVKSAFESPSPFDALLVPLGLGHHVDHRVVRDAVLPISATVATAFYEELPYATRDGVRIDLSRFRDDTEHKYAEHLEPVLCHGTHTRPTEFKRRIAVLYASQIDGALADTIAQFSHRYHGAERMWANALWLEASRRHHLSRLQHDPDSEPLPA